MLLVLVCNPALLIIDHGHFQYNGIGLGLTVWSIIIAQLLSRNTRDIEIKLICRLAQCFALLQGDILWDQHYFVVHSTTNR